MPGMARLKNRQNGTVEPRGHLPGYRHSSMGLRGLPRASSSDFPGIHGHATRGSVQRVRGRAVGIGKRANPWGPPNPGSFLGFGSAPRARRRPMGEGGPGSGPTASLDWTGARACAPCAGDGRDRAWRVPATWPSCGAYRPASVSLSPSWVPLASSSPRLSSGVNLLCQTDF